MSDTPENTETDDDDVSEKIMQKLINMEETYLKHLSRGNTKVANGLFHKLNRKWNEWASRQ